MVAEGGVFGKALVKLLEIRNKWIYKDPLGPTVKWFLENTSKNTYELIINGAAHSSPKVNRFLGII